MELRGEQLHFPAEPEQMAQVIPLPGRGVWGERLSPSPPEKNPLVRERSKTEHQRDEVWEACVTVLGFRPRTDSENSLWGKRVWSLVRAGATAGQITSCATAYHRTWPDMTLTINALEKWFSQFVAAKADTDYEFTCDLCSVSFKSQGRLSDHLHTSHGID